jgi:hypothetical protein
MVPLGFEVGTGTPVSVPLAHTVITGQTQRAGKTTALEALISRSRMKAVAFVTKRGEGSFSDAHTIAPYFRERADWQFVASLLEASRGEKMRFERAWIMRAAKGARSLADVRTNARQLMTKARNAMSEDMYMVLGEYLDVIVPEIDRIAWAKRVVLSPGLSVMDLTPLAVEMQHLVIRSTIEWVLQHENDAVVVVPEAWKFIPQGRGTPVKLAAESYIRQAATLNNYLWLDSQDIAGVEKLILKSVPVWILGVQREANEVKRTLAQIPAGIKKPKLEQIATLGLGEFFACHDSETTKVYVQPAWMHNATANDVARGKLTARAAAALSPRPEPDTPPEDPSVTEQEARELRAENARLRKTIDEMRDQITHLAHGGSVAKAAAKPPTSKPPVIEREVPVDGNGVVDERTYQAIKRRLLDEPEVLRVVAQRKQIDVEVKRETVTLDGASWMGRVAGLIAEGFFDEPRKSGHVFKEATRRGATGVGARADEACKKLLVAGFLTREEDGYLAVPNMKVNIVEGEG